MSYRNDFTANTCTESNQEGISIYGGGENRFVANTSSRKDTGIELDASHDNVFRANTVSENSYGMRGAGSTSIYINDFIDNVYSNYTNDPMAVGRYFTGMIL